MRIFVTGGAGFIGQHLVRLLVERGHTVTALDRREAAYPSVVTRVTCDILDGDELARAVQDAAPTCLLHLAATTHLEGRTLGDYAANIEGVANVLRAIAASRSVQRSICTSSQLVLKVGTPASSDFDYAPDTMYGRSKVESERLWREGEGGGADWCIVRPTTVWGPGMNQHYVGFFRMLAAGRYVHTGSALKTYGYVGNVVHEFEQLAHAPRELVHGRVFYLGDYRPLDIEEWAERFRNEMNAPKIRRVPMQAARLVARVGDIVNAIGFRRFPLNSVRLRNVSTSSVIDLAELEQICGELPFDIPAAVGLTVDWLRSDHLVDFPPIGNHP